jgi:hypothetical protein
MLLRMCTDVQPGQIAELLVSGTLSFQAHACSYHRQQLLKIESQHQICCFARGMKHQELTEFGKFS